MCATRFQNYHHPQSRTHPYFWRSRRSASHLTKDIHIEDARIYKKDNKSLFGTVKRRPEWVGERRQKVSSAVSSHQSFLPIFLSIPMSFPPSPTRVRRQTCHPPHFSLHLAKGLFPEVSKIEAPPEKPDDVVCGCLLSLLQRKWGKKKKTRLSTAPGPLGPFHLIAYHLKCVLTTSVTLVQFKTTSQCWREQKSVCFFFRPIPNNHRRNQSARDRGVKLMKTRKKGSFLFHFVAALTYMISSCLSRNCNCQRSAAPHRHSLASVSERFLFLFLFVFAV